MFEAGQFCKVCALAHDLPKLLCVDSFFKFLRRQSKKSSMDKLEQEQSRVIKMPWNGIHAFLGVYAIKFEDAEHAAKAGGVFL